jgi:hypothetical protein
MGHYASLLVVDEAWHRVEERAKRVSKLARPVSLTGLGFAAAYFLDPTNGHDRRAQMKRVVRGTGHVPEHGDRPTRRAA